MDGDGVLNTQYGEFDGNFQKGFLEGKAKALYTNGDKYFGEFRGSVI